MPDPHREPAHLTRRTVGRVTDAVRRVEDYDTANTNRTLPPDPRDQRGDRHMTPLKVTGSEDGTLAGLWPAIARYWTGHAGGTPANFADQPGQAACWAFPAPGGDDLTNTGEYLGLFVGIHSDGNAVFEALPLGGGGVLTTGNTGDAGAQDSTTTELRFDDSTKIKITKGATAGDPDVVSMDGLSASTTGLTVPGTTVAGVVTATRTLPALPRAWVNFAGRGTNGACTVNSQGGELGGPTVARTAAGTYSVTWAGMSVSSAAFCSGVSSAGLPLEIGTLLSTFGGNHIDLNFTVGGTADDPSDVYVTVIY